MRRLAIPTLALFLAGCGGTMRTAAPVIPPDAVVTVVPERPAPPQAAEPLTFISPIPQGWARWPGRKDGIEALVNPALQGIILFGFADADESVGTLAKDILANITSFTSTNFVVSPDGLRVSAVLKSTNPRKAMSGLLVVRRYPQGAHAPEENTVFCVGTWPTEHDAALSKDLNRYVDGFNYR